MKNNEYKEILAEAKKVSITSVMDDQGMEYIDMRNFAQGVEHDSWVNGEKVIKDVLNVKETMLARAKQEHIHHVFNNKS